MKVTLNDIARDAGPDYVRTFGDRMVPSHRKALGDMARCRTGLLGTQRAVCSACGSSHLKHHSCHNRSCPTCSYGRNEDWLTVQRTRLLAVPYFHLVFTVPEALRTLFRKHQQDFYPCLFRAAADTLLTLLADENHLGGHVGFSAVLHTWTQTLIYHPHLHCLVPGVALTKDGQLRLAKRSYLLPQAVLSRYFRGRLVTLLREARPDLDFPDSLFEQKWVVDCRPTLFHTESVLDYLGRYLHKIAISNARLSSYENQRVCFRYQGLRTEKKKWMMLHVHDFLSRFLQHVLPKGLHKVRHYGLLSSACRARLAELKHRLAQQAFLTGKTTKAPPDAAPPLPTRKETLQQAAVWQGGFRAYRCPDCSQIALRFIWVSLPLLRSRAPPEAICEGAVA